MNPDRYITDNYSKTTAPTRVAMSSDEADAYIRKWYGSVSSPQIADHLGWQAGRVRTRAQRLGIVQKRTLVPNARTHLRTAPRPYAAPAKKQSRAPALSPEQVAVRRVVESLHYEQALGSGGIRCACGRPGAPVHCHEHARLLAETG